MTITPELKRVVERSGGTPIQIEDPETSQGDILLTAEQDATLQSMPATDPVDEMGPVPRRSFRMPCF